MLLKLLFYGAVAGVIYFLFFSKKSLPTPPKDTNSKDEAMIPCASCGTYADIKETFIRDGKYYCSRECMEA